MNKQEEARNYIDEIRKNYIDFLCKRLSSHFKRNVIYDSVNDDFFFVGSYSNWSFAIVVVANRNGICRDGWLADYPHSQTLENAVEDFYKKSSLKISEGDEINDIKD